MPGGVFSTAKLHAMTIRESANDGSDFTNPDADYRRLFLGEDGQLHVKDSAGTVTDIGASAIDWGETGDIVDQDYDDTADAGVLNEAARADHRHGMPSEGAGPGGGFPLDGYSIDATYGDHFDAGSLDAMWTRRNFTGGAETYQVGPNGTHMRVALTSRANGDGYFTPAPGGDWEFAMAFIPRYWPTNVSLALAVVDSAGTGVTAHHYSSPNALLASALTTYTTYGGTFSQTTALIVNVSTFTEHKYWIRLRKASTNYFGSYSFDGEVWSPETAAFSWAGTVDRVGFMLAPLNTFAGTAVFDIDWFNKIA